MEQDGTAIDVSSDSDEAVDRAPAAGGDAGAPGSSSYPLPSEDRAVWTAPESSAAAGCRFFKRSRPWTDLTMDDVGGSSDEAPEVDLSDIISASESLNSLEEARRNFAATLAAEQRQFVASRDFLAERCREITVVRDELSLARAELERRDAELQERERGLAQREVAIDASSTTDQLQEQLAELCAKLDRDRVRYEQERGSGWPTGTGTSPATRRNSTG